MHYKILISIFGTEAERLPYIFLTKGQAADLIGDGVDKAITLLFRFMIITNLLPLSKSTGVLQFRKQFNKWSSAGFSPYSFAGLKFS